MKPRNVWPVCGFLFLFTLQSFAKDVRPPYLGQDLFPVLDDGKYGYVNQDGRIAIFGKFDEAGFFVEGLAAVRSGDKWGFINPKGYIEIRARFAEVRRFRDGLAAVTVTRLKIPDRQRVMERGPSTPSSCAPRGRDAPVRRP